MSHLWSRWCRRLGRQTLFSSWLWWTQAAARPGLPCSGQNRLGDYSHSSSSLRLDLPEFFVFTYYRYFERLSYLIVCHLSRVLASSYCDSPSWKWCMMGSMNGQQNHCVTQRRVPPLLLLPLLWALSPWGHTQKSIRRAFLRAPRTGCGVCALGLRFEPLCYLWWSSLFYIPILTWDSPKSASGFAQVQLLTRDQNLFSWTLVVFFELRVECLKSPIIIWVAKTNGAEV